MMTNAELMNLREALENKRLELASLLCTRARDLTIEDRPPDLIDHIQGMSNRDDAAGMLNRFSSTLTDVERSIRAIDENCYGNCTECDCPIPLKRLQSIPWATLCVRCQERFEAGDNEASEPGFHEPWAA
jgi:DnaK suppressor protein